MTIAAKPTLYADTRFRSRLEARWAVFFDAIGMPWTYEPVTVSGVGYQPDFALGAWAYIEIKPTSWAPADEWEERHERDFTRWIGFVAQVQRQLIVCVSEPGVWVNGRLKGLDQCLVIEPGDKLGHMARWGECGVCGAIKMVPRDSPVCDCPQEFEQLKRAMRAVRDFSYVDAP